MKNIRYQTIEQTSINDCGASCLYMILKFYGGFETLENLKKRTNTTKEGTTFYNLKEAAISLGFNPKCYYLENKELNLNIKTPFIAHVLIDNNYYHYIVVYKILKKKILIVDPAKGILEYMKKEQFKSIFEGNIMILYPSRPLYRNINHITISKMWKLFIRKDKQLLLKIIILSLFTVFIELICATSFYTLIKITDYNNIHLLFNFIVIFLILFILKNIFVYFRSKLFYLFEVKFENYLKMIRWRNIFCFPYRDLILKETGEISLDLEHSNEIVQFYLKLFFFICLDIPIFLITFAFIIFIDKECLFFVLILILEIIFSFYLKRKQIKYIKNYQYSLSKIKKLEDEVKESLISLKNTNLEQYTNQLLNDNYYTNGKDKILFSKKIFNINLKLNILNEICNLIPIVFIVVLLFYKIQTIENCILLFQLFSILNDTLKNLLDILLEKDRIVIYLESLTDDNNIKKEKSIVDNIKIINGKYYKFGNLKNISLLLKKGDKILLLGKSGSGKSTLMNILKGNYYIDTYYINGKKSNLPYERICYVESIPFIYTGTIKNNIDYGRNIEAKNIKEIMNLLNIYFNDTSSENINYLSSGEKQKVSLARALLGDFDILILDECLNQIGEQEEKEIMKKILDKFKDKIIIVITHRTNLKEIFSKIAVLTNHGQLKILNRKEKLCLEDFLRT